MIGGSDAGAHLDRMAGAPYTTAWLADCLRGRQLTSMENAIRHLTDVPARLFGLRDRGRVAEGYFADLVLFDSDEVGATDVELVFDLPGDSKRLYSEATGIRRVMVNGVTTVLDGQATDETPRCSAAQRHRHRHSSRPLTAKARTGIMRREYHPAGPHPPDHV